MQCDALDAAKYYRFAARARMDDDWELAKAFQRTADTDRTEYFAKEAELEDLIAGGSDNLRNAIDAEANEVKMFAQFALEARQDGDLDIAVILEDIGRQKAERCAAFEALLAEKGWHSNVHVVGK